MEQRLEPRLQVLPEPQRQIWPRLSPAPKLHLVLYGGTAVALHLGHRSSLDFDFFCAEPLDKRTVEDSFDFVRGAPVVNDTVDTLVVMAQMPTGPVKVSFFGGIDIGRINAPVRTADAVLLVASLEDLLATKLKAILDRAEAKDYHDIAAMLAAGISLERALAGFSKMYRRDPVLPLKALGYFEDGDLPTLPKSDQDLLRTARNRVQDIPDVVVSHGRLRE